MGVCVCQIHSIAMTLFVLLCYPGLPGLSRGGLLFRCKQAEKVNNLRIFRFALTMACGFWVGFSWEMKAAHVLLDAFRSKTCLRS